MFNINFPRLLFFVFCLLIASCKEESMNGPMTPIEPTTGSIKTNIRMSALTQSVPHWPVTLRLLRVKSGGYDTVQTVITDMNGGHLFTDLLKGSYILQGLPDAHYRNLTQSSVITISSSTPYITVTMVHQPMYHLAPDTLKLPVDSSIVTDRTTLTLLWNEGVRDTLHCTFDLTLVPSWCSVQIKETTFLPLHAGSSYNLVVDTKKETFPRNSLPLMIKIPVLHQFDNDTLYIRFLYQSSEIAP